MAHIEDKLTVQERRQLTRELTAYISQPVQNRSGGPERNGAKRAAGDAVHFAEMQAWAAGKTPEQRRAFIRYATRHFCPASYQPSARSIPRQTTRPTRVVPGGEF